MIGRTLGTFECTALIGKGGMGSGSSDIGILPSEDKAELRPLLNKKYMEKNGKISPDEHWLGYESNEEGRFEVFVCSYPGVGTEGTGAGALTAGSKGI